MTSARRILFAIPTLDRGGPDRVFFEILRHLDRSRFTPSVMVNEPTGHFLAQLPADIPVHVLGRERSVISRYPVLTALRHIRRLAPEVVLATLRMIPTLGLAARAMPRTTRLVFRPASPVSADFGALVQQSVLKHRVAAKLVVGALRRADAVVCQSESMRADLGSLFGTEARLHVIANPIDVPTAMQHATRKDGVVRGAPSLISVGRLVALKGYDLLLRALALVRAAHPGIHLTIIGDGPERARLDALARELAVSDLVTLAGYDPEPLPRVRAADLFVLTSRYDAFANSALEALACGTPVLLTDCPGANRQIVRDGVNGRLAPSLEPAVIAASLARMIAELPAYDGARIQADCTERFASGSIVRAYEGVFEAVCEPRAM